MVVFDAEHMGAFFALPSAAAAGAEAVVGGEDRQCVWGRRHRVLRFWSMDDWHEDAACHGHPTPQIWFPERGHHPDAERQALGLCRSCPVRLTCLAGALRRGERFGIWGGLTVLQLGRARRLARAGTSLAGIVEIVDGLPRRQRRRYVREVDAEFEGDLVRVSRAVEVVELPGEKPGGEAACADAAEEGDAEDGAGGPVALVRPGRVRIVA